MQVASTSTRFLGVLALAAVTLAIVGAIAGGHAIAAGWRLDPSHSIAAGEMPLISRLSYTGGYRFIASEPAVASFEPAPTRRQPDFASLPAAQAVVTGSTLPKVEPVVAVVGTPREAEPRTRVIVIEPPAAVFAAPVPPAAVEPSPGVPVALPTELPSAPSLDVPPTANLPAPAATAVPAVDARPPVVTRPEPDAKPDAKTATMHSAGSPPMPQPDERDHAVASTKPAEHAVPVATAAVATGAISAPASTSLAAPVAPAASTPAPPSPAAKLDDDDEAEEDTAPLRPRPKRVIARARRQTTTVRPAVRKAPTAGAGADTSASPSPGPRWARGAFAPG